MLPQDPIMLLSFLNMKLRDRYGSLSELCDDLDESEEAILTKMSEAGYEYDASNNQFVLK